MQPGLLGPDPGRLGLHGLGVTTRPVPRRFGGQVPGPLGGQLRGTAEPLLQRGQPVPGLLRPGQPWCVGGHGLVQFGLPGLCRGQFPLHLGATPPQFGLVGDLPVQGGAQADQIVGEQTQSGVTQLGLHRGGPSGDLGLPAQRFELSTQFGGQVGQPGEVGLHRVQLAERLLLALAMLEYAGSLLDEAAAILRPGLQHRVELTLPDNHVHFPAYAGIGQEFLDIEKTAVVAIDLVLALAGPKHPTGD